MPKLPSSSHANSPNDAIARAFVGVGLRPPHYREMLAAAPALAMLEVHSENYFGAGGQPLHFLTRFREHYPLSLHGVGLSLGSTDPLNERHIDHLARLVQRFEPALVSEHLSWSSIGGRYANDLLPLPYTKDALERMCARVDAPSVQQDERLSRNR
jgi:uncharacterized protein